MSFAPQPLIQTPSTRLKKSTPPASMSGANIKPLLLPKQKPPAHLRSLLVLQKSASLVTLSLIGAALGVYAWTVYIPKLWNKEYNKLETLQRYERQLQSTNETIKEQLAQQAEKPGNGLVNPNPAQTIFLPAAPEMPNHPAKKASPESKQAPLVTTPLAY